MCLYYVYYVADIEGPMFHNKKKKENTKKTIK